MLDLLQITDDVAFARRCDALVGLRLFVDLERNGKAERQAGRNTFISAHELADVGRVKAVLHQARLMVRVNPLHAQSAAEVDAVLAQGVGSTDMLMLPMFKSAQELADFSAIVAGRVPIVALLETAEALASLDDWITTPGLAEVYVGLNDLHLSLGLRFMFEPLANGLVERVARAAAAHGLRFGFGGVARLDEGLLPGRDVLAEHLRLGSRAVILSRTFHRSPDLGTDPASAHGAVQTTFEDEIAAIRVAEAELAQRSAVQIEADRVRIAACIESIAQGMGRPATPI